MKIKVADITVLERKRGLDDENFQHGLNKLQESQQALRRRKIWELEHGEIKAGRPKKSKNVNIHQSGKNPCMEEIARLLGMSVGATYDIIKVAQDLDPEVQETIAGLPICNNRSELKRLAALPVKEQRIIAERLKDGAITKVPAIKPPTVDEDAPPEAPEAPKPLRTPRTPQKLKEDNPADWNRKVKEAIKEFKTTAEQQIEILDEYGGYFHVASKSQIIFWCKNITNSLSKLKV